MRACMDWSYELLSSEEQSTLCRLAVFSGGWTLEAAEAVCQNENLVDLLARLLQKSLVRLDRQESEGVTSRHRPRYGMLETVRQYALEKLVLSGEEQASRDRLLEYLAARTEKGRPKMMFNEYVPVPHALSAELGNVRSALQWAANSTLEEQIAKGLWVASSAAIHIPEVTSSEAYAWLMPGIQRLEGNPEHHRACAYALLVLGLRMNAGLNRMEEAIRLVERSVLLFAACGDRAGLGWAKVDLGGLLNYVDHARALQHLDEGYAISREIGDESNMALALNYKSSTLVNLRMYEQAATCLVECAELYRKVGDSSRARIAMDGLAYIAVFTGDFDRAAEIIKESYGHVSELEGNQAEKERNHLHEVEVFLAYRLEDFARMEQFAQAMVDYYPVYDPENSLARIYVLRLLGIAVHRRCDCEKAATIFRQGVEMAKQKGDTYGVLTGLAGWAASLAELGKEKLAAIMLGSVEALFEGFSKPMDYIDQLEFDRTLQRLHQRLSPNEFNKAWQEGYRLSLSQVLEAAVIGSGGRG